MCLVETTTEVLVFRYRALTGVEAEYMRNCHGSSWQAPSCRGLGCTHKHGTQQSNYLPEV